MPAPTSHRPKRPPTGAAGKRTHERYGRETRGFGGGGDHGRTSSYTKKPGEKWDPKKALRRAGFQLADEAKGFGYDLSRLGNGLQRVGAGDFTSDAANVVVVVFGGILGLLFLDLLLSDRGSKISAAGLRWSTGLIRGLVDPGDPLIAAGHSTATPAKSTAAPAKSTAAPTYPAAGGGATTAPGSGRYGEPLYPTPTGRLVPLPGSSAGHLVDSAYVSLITWIEHHFGVVASSGVRDPAHNAAVGGAPGSDHIENQADGRHVAVDFAAGSTGAAGLERLYRWALAFGFPFVESPAQAAANGEGPHVHISFFRPSTTD